jgi:hypothetical protein
MALPNLQIPPMECPATLLPTPANLSNMFGGLATFPEKLKALAITTAKNEAADYIEMAESLQDTVDTVRKFFGPYDPKWEKISIPEKEWEIMIQRLIEEYPMYIQAQIMSLISSFVSFTMPLLGIQIDVLKLVTDRSYLNELGIEIAGNGADIKAQIAALSSDLSPEARQDAIDKLKNDKIDTLFKLLPDEYKLFAGEYGLENQELKVKQIMDYIKNEATKFMNGQLFSGFGGLIEVFQGIWDAFDLPSLPVPLDLDIKGMIDAAIVDGKDDAAKLAALKEIKIAGFDVMALLGGEFTDNVESLEFQIARIQTKLKEFKENYQLFLLKEWMSKVTAFFNAIGLGALTQYATLDFCTFMVLMGVPTTIDLSSFEEITTVATAYDSGLPSLSASDNALEISVPGGSPIVFPIVFSEDGDPIIENDFKQITLLDSLGIPLRDINDVILTTANINFTADQINTKLGSI